MNYLSHHFLCSNNDVEAPNRNRYESVPAPCATLNEDNRLTFTTMEPGLYQEAEGICYSDVQPLSMGPWESYNHDPFGRLTGTCVWTVQPPDGFLPVNLHHTHQHEPSEAVHSHCLSFSPVAGLPENDSHSSLSPLWVAAEAFHCGMMPGELHNAIAGIGPSESQGALQCQKEPTNSHDSLTKVDMGTGVQMMFTNHCPPAPDLRTMDPPFSVMPAHKPAPVTTQKLHGQAHVNEVSVPEVLTQEDHDVCRPLVPEDPPASLSTQYQYMYLHASMSQKQQMVYPLCSKTRVSPGEWESEDSGARMSWTVRDPKSKKPCSCTKSQCLKRYCDCFANGEVCSNCNCLNCCNNVEHPVERHHAILNCLDRNPEAFKFNLVSRQSGEVKGQPVKGCNCKQSSCLKNYCECYKAKMVCSSTCKCVGCLNCGGNSEVKAGVQGSSEISPSKKMHKETCHPSLITLAVVADTCNCLLAQAGQAEREGCDHTVAQRMILQEFGHCLTSIVESI